MPKPHPRSDKQGQHQALTLLDIVFECRHVQLDNDIIDEIQRISARIDQLEQSATEAEITAIDQAKRQFSNQDRSAETDDKIIKALESAWETNERKYDFIFHLTRLSALQKAQQERETPNPLHVIESQFSEIESKVYGLSNLRASLKLRIVKALGEYKTHVTDVLNGLLNEDFFLEAAELKLFLLAVGDALSKAEDKERLAEIIAQLSTIGILAAEASEIIEAVDGTIELYLKNDEVLDIRDIDNFSSGVAKNLLTNFKDTPKLSLKQASFLVKKQLEEKLLPFQGKVKHIHKKYDFPETQAAHSQVLENVAEDEIVEIFRYLKKQLSENDSDAESVAILPGDQDRPKEDVPMDDMSDERAELAASRKEAFRKDLQQDTTRIPFRLSNEPWFNFYYDLLEKEDVQQTTLIFKGLATLASPPTHTAPAIPVEKGPGRRGRDKVTHQAKSLSETKFERPLWTGRSKKIAIRMPQDWVRYLDKLDEHSPKTKSQIILTGLAELGAKHGLTAPPVPNNTFIKRLTP